MLRVSFQMSVENTLATLYSTTFLPVRSDLLPTRSLFTPSEAYRSISWSHCFTLVKLSDHWGMSTNQYNQKEADRCWLRHKQR